MAKKDQTKSFYSADEARYRFLFENVPISLWEEDFSDVRVFLNELARQGVLDFRRYFTENPEDLRTCVRKVKVLDVNQFTLSLYRYPSKEALMQGLSQTFGPESYAVFREELVSLLEGNLQFQTEAITYKSTGEKFFIQIGVKIPEEHRNDWARVLVSIADISSRVQMEQALKESEEKFRGLVETSTDGIVMTDEVGRVVQWNRSAEEIFGIPKEKAIGQPLFDIQLQVTPKDKLTPELKKLVKKRLEDFFRSRTASWLNRRFETKIQLKSGECKIIESVVFPVSTEKGVVLASLIRDVTQRIRAEEKLRRSLEEKEILLKEIHHRVKNNLQIVSSLLRLQADGISDPRVKQILLQSQNRIRTMALIHQKLYGGNLDRIDFVDYARSLIDEISQAYQNPERKIHLCVTGEPAFLSVSQAVSCGLILNELVTNSLKYAFPASFFSHKGRKATISAALNKISEEGYRLVVSDNGVGMPADFNWEEPASLGLRLVKILAEDQLKGTLSVHSDSGTEFVIQFNKDVVHAQT